MSYNYSEVKPRLFTEDGVNTFVKIRDKVNQLVEQAGAVRAQESMVNATGDTWTMLASLDRMVELGELKELTQLPPPIDQYRVFIKAN